MRSPSLRTSLRASLLLAAALLCGAEPLHAQYFGRNNPQFRTFDFQVLRTEHLDIYYYPEAEQGVRDAARMAERWYTRLSAILQHEFTHRQPLILYASSADFQQTNILSSPVGEGTGGVTESAKQRVIMPLAHTYAETDHILGHELVHAFQYDISRLGRSGGSIDAGGRALAQTPLWFIEGMAEYLSLGPEDSHTAMWLRDAALTGRLPTLQQLATDPRVFPYRYGHALWTYITGRWGDAVVGQILREVARGAPYNVAMQRVLNVPLDQLSDDWQAAVRRTYLPLLAEHAEAREVGVPLITHTERGGRVNIAPALSPDGRRVAFLSERGQMDIELWLADAETGEVIRRLVRGTTLDAHFSSINFIGSAGSFSPDGRQLVFTALRTGRDVIAIVDAERGGVVRQIPVPGVSTLTNPDWSPDGRSIVFSGNRGGITNLYLLDLQTEEVRQLTEGRFSDLMPVFSPDGGRVAFVTARGEGTDLEALRFGPYRLAVYDLGTGEITLLPLTGGARDFNPAWTRDGQGLFFLSDRTGIANVHRLDVATGTITQVTNVFQGISGYTELSPAMSAARNADRIAFAAYERGGYNIYRLDDPVRLAGVPIDAPEALATVPALLPPVPRPEEPLFHRVAQYLEQPLAGLPTLEVAAAWTPEPYRPRLSLDYLGQPQVGVSTGGGFGRGGLHGGIAALWSDMLARHTVWGIVQAQGAIEETGFAAAYLYRRHRWDYGVATQRIPYISARRQRFFDTQANLLRDQVVAFRTFETQVQGLAQFPFSRPQRLEFSGGYRRISRDLRIQEVVADPIRDPQGVIVGYQNPRYQESTQGLDGFNLFEGSAALVYDNALFGFTSPVAGQRYRFEVSPTVGDFNFLTGLADYRRYLWARPLTLAGRGLHFGRYGLDAEEERQVGPIFLGYPSLMRGYAYGSVEDRCLEDVQQGNETSEDCVVLDQLFGSRIALANLELRFPLVQALVLGGGIGFPPIEGFAFYDAGVAWGRGTTPVFGTGVQPLETERGILTSAGVGTRINVLGYLIAEIVYARPFAGSRGWQWQFALQPGF
jgi:Tol biopolymer transport system component